MIVAQMTVTETPALSVELTRRLPGNSDMLLAGKSSTSSRRRSAKRGRAFWWTIYAIAVFMQEPTRTSRKVSSDRYVG